MLRITNRCPFQFQKPSLLTLVFVVSASTVGLADDARQAERAAQFEREIRPVLIGQCIKCHGESKKEGGLRLDTRTGLLEGGDSGPAVVEGNPDQSLLIDALHHRDLEMPPDSKLPEQDHSSIRMLGMVVPLAKRSKPDRRMEHHGCRSSVVGVLNQS